MRTEIGESRIKLSDTGLSATMKMAESNAGAIAVLAKSLAQGGDIDPDSFMGGMANLLDLDTNRIYGTRIWMLYKDVCGQDLRVMTAILRSVQLGFLPITKLQYAIDNCGDGIDVPDFVAQVEKRLPNFKKG